MTAPPTAMGAALASSSPTARRRPAHRPARPGRRRPGRDIPFTMVINRRSQNFLNHLKTPLAMYARD